MEWNRMQQSVGSTRIQAVGVCMCWVLGCPRVQPRSPHLRVDGHTLQHLNALASFARVALALFLLCSAAVDTMLDCTALSDQRFRSPLETRNLAR